MCVECGHYEFFSTKKLKEYENKNVKKSNLEINRENVEYSLSNDDIENVGRILKGKDILPNVNELIKLILNTCMEISKITIVKEVVGAAVESVVSMTCDNIINLSTGKGEFHSEAEIAHNVVYDTVTAATTAFITKKISIGLLEESSKEVSGIIFETVVGNVFNIANDCIKKPIFELLQYNW